MLLLEALIYNGIAILLPLLGSSSHENDKFFRVCFLVNILSSLVATGYAIIRKGADVHGTVMGSTMLSSFTLAYYSSSFSMKLPIHKLGCIGWIVSSGFLFSCFHQKVPYFWIVVHVTPLLLLDVYVVSAFFDLKFNDYSVDVYNKNLPFNHFAFAGIGILHHGMVIFQCYISYKYFKIDTGCSNRNDADDNNASRSRAQIPKQLFSLGEWYTLTTLIFFLMTDFFLQFLALPSSPYPSHVIVAQSGIVGCICGCLLSYAIPPLCRNSFATISLQCLLIVFVTFTSVEFSLQQHFKDATSIYDWNTDALSSTCANLIGDEIQQHQLQQDCSKFSTTTHNNIDASVLPLWTACSSFLPLHIRWIVTFLLTPEGIDALSLIQHRCSTYTSPLNSNIIDNTPRGWCLVYWAIILILTFPLAIALARHLLQKKKNVCQGRKFFHFIAVILFAPVTWYSPSMMTLSYAVAMVALVLGEILRLSYNKSQSTIQTTEEHPKRKEEYTAKTNTENNGIVSFNDFYIAFLDEKDCEGKSGGLVVTHIALIFGCAFPQWVAATTAFSASKLLPVIGVLVLGIGDAFGAIVGTTKYGRTKWASNNRTLEGSASMFLSMLIFCFGFLPPSEVINLKVVIPLVILTLLEASTLQIDNLCLPIVGTTILLMMGPSTN